MAKTLPHQLQLSLKLLVCCSNKEVTISKGETHLSHKNIRCEACNLKVFLSLIFIQEINLFISTVIKKIILTTSTSETLRAAKLS